MGKKSLRLVHGLLAALLVACAAAPTHQPAVTASAASASARADAAAASIRTSAPVVIVGSGLTGLTIAYELEKAGIEALVVESAPRYGGRIQTVTFTDGATAEGHMEEYFERSPAVPLLRELRLPLIEDVAHSTVRIDGKIHPYQGEGDRDTYLAGIFDAEERAAFLRWNEKAWKLYEELHASHYAGKPLPPELAALTKVSFKDFVEGDGLPHKVSEWIRVTVEPEMAIEWDQISALDGIDEVRLFLDTPDGFGEKNYHVAEGNTNFVNALASKLEPSQILTNARVTAIEQDAAGRAPARSGGRPSLRRGDGKDGGRHRAGQPPRPHPVHAAAVGREAQGDRDDAHGQLHQGPLPRRPRRRKAVDGRRRKHADAALRQPSRQHLRRHRPAERSRRRRRRRARGRPHPAAARALRPHADEPARRRDPREMRRCPRGALPRPPRLPPHAEIFVYPQAVAYWPLEHGRSRFDDLANELRRPQGRLYIGGDTTEDSHSEGAVVAALRISKDIIARRAELQ